MKSLPLMSSGGKLKSVTSLNLMKSWPGLTCSQVSGKVKDQ